MSKWPHLEFYMETQKTSNSQTILRKKNRTGGTTLSDFRLYYKAIVVKAVWYWYKNRHTSVEQDRAQRKKNLHTYVQPTTKEAKIQDGEKAVFSVSGTYIVICKRIKLEHSLTSYTKINSKWIKGLNVRPDTIKLLEENTGRTSFDINCSNIFFLISLLKKRK